LLLQEALQSTLTVHSSNITTYYYILLYITYHLQFFCFFQLEEETLIDYVRAEAGSSSRAGAYKRMIQNEGEKEKSRMCVCARRQARQAAPDHAARPSPTGLSLLRRTLLAVCRVQYNVADTRRQTDRRAGRQTHTHSHTRACVHIYIMSQTHPDRPTDTPRKTDRQTGRQKDRHTLTHTCVCIYIHTRISSLSLCLLSLLSLD